VSVTLKRIEKATTVLVLDQPFFASLAMGLKVVESEDRPTFSTDGVHLFVNPKFAETLSDEEVGTVLAHEVLHGALGHLWRMTPLSHPDVDCRQRAADYEVNEMLDDANKHAKNRATPFPFPKGALLDPRFKGVGAEKIYSTLLQEKPPPGGGGGKPGKPGNKPGQKPQPGQQPGTQPGNEPSMGEFEPAPGKQSEQKKLQEDWKQKVIQAAQACKNKGDIPGAILQLVEQMTKTAVDWKAVLREFCRRAKDDYSFSVPNRRYSDSEFIMPSLHSERLGKLLFAIDTSGSISSNPELLSEFIGQSQLVLDELLPESLEIVCCDARITQRNEYVPGDTIKGDAPGGGGTDFRPVFKDLPEDVIAVVYLTDMYGTFPREAPEVPTLWVSYGGKEQPPFGQLVPVE
jgi:predicted metal-dependent peptidase